MANKNAMIGELAQADTGIQLTKASIQILLDNPDSVLQTRGRDFRIYDELLRDDQVRSTFQQRRTAVTRAEMKVEAASESAADVAAADDLREQLLSINFDDLTDKMLYGVFYGYAIAECMWGKDNNRVTIDQIKVRDRSRFKYNAGGELVLIDSRYPSGKVMPDRKFWQFSIGANHDDNPYGMGLGHSLYWPVFFKRNDIKFWLIFLEKFGQPTVAATMPGSQMDIPAEKTKALQALYGIQNDSAVIIPDGMQVDLIEASRSGTADYATLCDKMDSAIAKVVLSQTMTTDDGSSRSQAEIHQDVADAVIASDADLLCFSFCEQVAKWLTEWNHPGARTPIVYRVTEPPCDLNEIAERDTKVAQLGFEPTEQYIQETYGDGWVKRQAPTPPSNPLAPMGPEFTEVNRIQQQRVGSRADQQSMAEAAEYLSSKYKSLLGERVEQLLAYLEETSDIETFNKRLTEMMAEVPPTSSVEQVQNATLAARMMGMLRGQR